MDYPKTLNGNLMNRACFCVCVFIVFFLCVCVLNKLLKLALKFSRVTFIDQTVKTLKSLLHFVVSYQWQTQSFSSFPVMTLLCHITYQTWDIYAYISYI